jgi:polyisoprenoid-binding protein YceI
MKKLALYSAVIVTALLFSFKTLAPSVWKLDAAHSKLGFSVTHMVVSDIEGAFTSFDATINSVSDDFSGASVTMTADVATVNTAQDRRDGHLKSADFFDAAKYPTITFASTSFKKTGPNVYTVTGSLTMHGVTKPVTLTATAKMGADMMSKKTIAGFKIEGTFKRSDFGIGASFPAAAIGDDITLVSSATFVKQ